MKIQEVIRYGIEYLVRDIEKARSIDAFEEIDNGRVAVYMHNKTIYKSIVGNTGLWLALYSLNNGECELFRISANKNTIEYQIVDFKKLAIPEGFRYE